MTAPAIRTVTPLSVGFEDVPVGPRNPRGRVGFVEGSAASRVALAVRLDSPDLQLTRSWLLQHSPEDLKGQLPLRVAERIIEREGVVAPRRPQALQEVPFFELPAEVGG